VRAEHAKRHVDDSAPRRLCYHPCPAVTKRSTSISVTELERRDLLLKAPGSKGVLLRDLLGQIRAAQLCTQRALQRLAKLCSSALRFWLGSGENLMLVALSLTEAALAQPSSSHFAGVTCMLMLG